MDGNNFYSFVLIIIYSLFNEVYSISEGTYYQPFLLNHYTNYGNVAMFEYLVPEATYKLTWDFRTDVKGTGCLEQQNTQVFIQYGGYPVFDSAKSFPRNYHLRRSNLCNVSVPETKRPVSFAIDNPLPGRWFGVAYLTGVKDDAVTKITDHKCLYTMKFNVSVLKKIDIKDISHQSDVQASLTSENTLFRFLVDSDVWKFSITITDCQVGSTSQQPSACPLKIFASSWALPSNNSEDTSFVDCQDSSSSSLSSHYTLKHQRVRVEGWQYLMLVKAVDKELTVRIKIDVADCLNFSPHENAVISHVDRSVLRFTPLNTTGTDQNLTARPIDVVKRPPPILVVGRRGPEEPSPFCARVPELQRVESIDNSFYVIYSVSTSYIENVVRISERSASVVKYHVLPYKDMGGTLRFHASMMDFVNTSVQNVTISICLQNGVVPLRGDEQLYCSHEDDLLTLTTVDTALSADRYVPYPEYGPWFIGAQIACHKTDASNSSMQIPVPCVSDFYYVLFHVVSTECENGACGDHGTCQNMGSGSLAYSGCKCVAGFRGYTCMEASRTQSLTVQMLYTLSLTLSNLFFIPAIILSCKRHYFVEAVAYSANMFFSSFYHACDMPDWSIYTLCIMPYQVLSYCDFFCSIMSFWMTLIAMAQLPSRIKSILHIVGAYALIMLVEWREHDIYPYAVPIGVGCLVALISLIVQSVRQKRCILTKCRATSLVSGILLAIMGVCIFVFLETNSNYPLTHAAWHVCMSLCVVFLLPTRRPKKSAIADDQSSLTCDVELNDSDGVRILTADMLNGPDHSFY